MTTATLPIRERAQSRVQFRIAIADDDAPLRRLLRENPMAGDIRLSLEREPNYFAAAGIEGPDSQTIVAIDQGRVVCAGSISARMQYVNGHPMRVGYLGGLRLDASCRNRISIIRRGYEMFRELHKASGPPIYLTSIVANNHPARRLLERGLPGMPTYQLVGEFTTLVIRSRGRSLASDPGSSPKEITDVLGRDLPKFQFASVWTEQDMRSEQRCPGLLIKDFHLIRDADGLPLGCGALWDQRSFKQTIVRGYSSRFSRMRPLVNCAAALLSTPRLPAIGEAIPHAFVSHLSPDVSEPKMTEDLIRSLALRARARNIDYLTAGFDSRDPRLPHLRRAFRPREYISRLYVVHWDDRGAELARQLDARLLAPEAALL